jgi:hypothetical protein
MIERKNLRKGLREKYLSYVRQTEQTVIVTLKCINGLKKAIEYFCFVFPRSWYGNLTPRLGKLA